VARDLLLADRCWATLRLSVPVWSFMRHAQSVANAEGWYAGTFDAALTELGERQAMAARAEVAKTPFVRAFSSDLQRARRTAELVLAGRDLSLVQSPSLRERCCGAWECRAVGDIESNGLEEVLLTFRQRPPGGESLRDVAERALRWLAEVDDSADTLVVAHGALIRSVIGVLDGTPEHRIGTFRPGNCEIVRRQVPVGHWATLLERL
jgi:alpha-ribazole phosphatase